jgi:tetratricopeptide (TPR) repeat protein
MRFRGSKLRRPVLFIAAMGLVWLCGCAANAPWLHHADDKPFYESTYFRVASPKGTGWKAVEERPSEVLERFGFHYEPDLFDEFIAPRFSFERYTTRDVLPQPTRERRLIDFYSSMTRPGANGGNPREIAEAENRNTLARMIAQADTLIDPKWVLERSSELTIGARDYHEFVMANGGTGNARRYLIQYISFSKDLGVACIAIVHSDTTALPEEAGRILETLEPVERAAPPATLAMERAVQDLYELTLKRYEGRTFVVYPGDIERDLHEVLRADPRHKKAHLFLGAVQLLTEDLGPVLGDAGRERVKLGLWDFYCVSAKGAILHSLFDGYSLVDQTLDEFRAELQADPRSFWANYYLAGLYVRHEKYKEAESQARLLTEYYPESALAWYTLGIALKRAGNTSAARIAFSTALHNYRGDFDDTTSDALAAKNIIQAQLRSLDNE